MQNKSFHSPVRHGKVHLLIDVQATFPGLVVNDHLASETIRILTRNVRVIPVGASRVRREGVSERVSRLNRALSNLAGTVVTLGPYLPHAMEMK